MGSVSNRVWGTPLGVLEARATCWFHQRCELTLIRGPAGCGTTIRLKFWSLCVVVPSAMGFALSGLLAVFGARASAERQLCRGRCLCYLSLMAATFLYPYIAAMLAPIRSACPAAFGAQQLALPAVSLDVPADLDELAHARENT
jgi:hypothetical protein